MVTHVAFHTDIGTIARGTIRYGERMVSRDPSGITGFDGRQTMLTPSVVSA